MRMFFDTRTRSAAGAALLFCFLASGAQAGLFSWFSHKRTDLGPPPPVIRPEYNGQDPAGPKVLTVEPTGTTQDKGEATQITVTFDRPMVSFEALSKEETAGPLRIEPPLSGVYRWFGTSTLVFRPAKPLPAGTRYTLAIPQGTSAKDGSKMSRDFRWTFDTVRPEFLNSNPYHESDFVELKPEILLAFNEPMSAERAEGYFELRGKPTEHIFERVAPFAPGDYPETVPVAVRAATKEEFEKNSWFTKDASHCLVVTPKKELEREHTYTLIVKEGLLAAEGNIGLEASRNLQFKTYNNFRVIEVKSPVHPLEGLRITFSNPVSGSDLYRYLSMNPPLVLPDELAEENYPHYEKYVGLPLKPRQTYEVLIRKGLKDKFEQTIKDDFHASLEVTSYVPWIQMPTGNLTVEAKMRHQIPVSLINMRSAEKRLEAVAPASAIQRLSKKDIESDETDESEDQGETWTFSRPLDRSIFLPLELDPVLKESQFGLVFASLKAGEPNPEAGTYPISIYEEHPQRFQKAFVQVTNLGVTAKCSPESNLIWVTFLSTTRPVPGAEVQLYDDSGTILWKGKTDRNGLAISPGWALLKVTPGKNRYGNPRVWIVARYRDDAALIASNWGTGIYPYEFGLSYEPRQIYPEVTGDVYTDRGLYQAGETVHIKGMFRQKKNGDWVLSSLQKVLLTVSDSRGEELLKKELDVSEYGSFFADFPVAPKAVTGYYSIRVSDPKDGSKEKSEPSNDEAEGEQAESEEPRSRLSVQGSFQVEAYRPAKFEATVSLSSDAYVLGAQAEARLKGWFLFGAPMKNAPVKWTAKLWESNFTPPGYPGYLFGPQRYLVSEEETAHENSLDVASGEVRLDDKGEARVRVPLEAKTLEGALQLSVEATVTDQDRQSLSGRKSATVHPGDYYLGLKPSTTFLEKKDKLSLLVVAVDPEGHPVADRPIEIRFIRREWNSVRKSGIKGRTAWVVEKNDIEVATNTIRSGVEPQSVLFQPPQAGYYLVRARSRDSSGRTLTADAYFYAVGTDYVPWARTDDDRIELVADQNSYKPGQTARVMVKSPFEEAVALVSLEREGILDQFTTVLKGSADIVKIPMTDRLVPNVFVSVVLLQGRTSVGKYSESGEDVGKPGFKIGYVNLPVDPGTRRLAISVKADKPEYRPRQRTTITFHVANQAGHPEKAECSISVADLGILNLIGYTTPDSFNAFYGPRPLSIETVESRLHVIGQRNYGEKGENRGGGGSALGLLSDANLRTLFRGTAYWKADVVTDENGMGQVSFDLPDDLTTFKIMVTGHTKNSLFGAGDSQLRVKKPLMIKPALPRFARLGDHFQAGIVIHNYTGQPGAAHLETAAHFVTMSGPAAQEISLADTEGKEIRFDYVADKLGTAVLSYGARLGSETDGLSVNLPVIRVRSLEAVALYDNTTQTAEQPVKWPTDIDPLEGGLQIEAASTAFLGLKQGIRYLEEFPHECLEQKISRHLPFLLAGDLLEAFGLSELSGAKKKNAIEDVIRQLPQFQLDDGGFTYWPGDPVPCEYITAYALYFLHEARREGFVVDQKMVTKGLDFLATVLNRLDSDTWNFPYNDNARLTTKSFIVYVMGLWDRNEASYTDRLYEARDRIPLFGRAYLLKAVRVQHLDASMAQELSAGLLNSIKEDPARAHFEDQDPAGLDWIFDSPVRTTGFILQALVENGTELPQAAKVVRWLMDERKQGRWRSTQENIYVFYGLSEYFRKYESEEPHFRATVKLGGQLALEALFNGRENKPVMKTLRWSDLPPGQDTTATFAKEGPGRLYYGLRMIYAPLHPLPERSEGLTVERTMTLEDGKPLPASIPAGTKILVKLSVTTPFDRTYIAVEDPLPAGFQPLNTHLQTSNSQDQAALDKNQSYAEWWAGFNHTETYDDRVVFYSDYLEHGSHTVAYIATAITPGVFSQPGAHAEGMYTPEVFGRTKDSSVEIK